MIFSPEYDVKEYRNNYIQTKMMRLVQGRIPECEWGRWAQKYTKG
jgi:hypothetical protein